MRTVFNALLLEPFDGILWMGEEYLSSHEGSTAQREELHGNGFLSSVSISVHQWLNVFSSLRCFRVFRGSSCFHIQFRWRNPFDHAHDQGHPAGHASDVGKGICHRDHKGHEGLEKMGNYYHEIHESTKKGGERLIGDNSPYRVRGFQAWDNPLT